MLVTVTHRHSQRGCDEQWTCSCIPNARYIHANLSSSPVLDPVTRITRRECQYKNTPLTLIFIFAIMVGHPNFSFVHITL